MLEEDNIFGIIKIKRKGIVKKIFLLLLAALSFYGCIALVDERGEERKVKSFIMPKREVLDTLDKIDNIAVVSAVGAGMAGTPGVAGRIFSALGREKINVIMISQSCSEFNVSFAVKREEGKKAVMVIHDEFKLAK